MSKFLRATTAFIAMLACLAHLGVLPPAARAEPGTTPAIAWSQVGLSNRIELSGSGQAADVSLPVPQGVSPTVLTGVIGSVVNAVGRVDVFDARAVLLGSIPIPTEAAALPFAVDIAAAEVSVGVARLSFLIRSVDTNNGDGCAEPPQVTLSQLATTYSGPTPNPRTVADFLPGYLDQITIEVGPDPTRDEQQAALALVANLTHLYRPMPVRIDVDTAAPPPAENLGTRRVIALRDGAEPGLVVENPDSPTAVLAISGRGPELLRQVELFADRRFEVVQTAAAEVTSAEHTGQVSATRKTFEQLGMSSETAVLGNTTVYIGFDVAAFGVGSIDGATVHLIAHYSPVVTGDASVVLRSGNFVVASAILGESGVVDLTGDIPAAAVGSRVGLALEIRYIPDRGCGPVYDRMNFFVDPTSTVDVHPGSNNRGGFPVLPMAFTPEFDVTLERPELIAYAAQAINLMGQESTLALHPNVTTLESASARGVGLLAVGSGQTLADAGLQPPLVMTGADAVDVNGSPITGIDLNGPLGIVEAFAHNGRTVLAIEVSGDGSLIARSLDYIRGMDGRWASLTGDVVATGAAGVTVALTVRAGGPMAYQPIPDEGWSQWLWVTLAVAAAIILALALLLIVRRRRAKP